MFFTCFFPLFGAIFLCCDSLWLHILVFSLYLFLIFLSSFIHLFYYSLFLCYHSVILLLHYFIIFLTLIINGFFNCADRWLNLTLEVLTILPGICCLLLFTLIPDFFFNNHYTMIIQIYRRKCYFKFYVISLFVCYKFVSRTPDFLISERNFFNTWFWTFSLIYILCIRIITDVLIDHVSDDEKIRIDRKAVKLVKLAILPSDVRIFIISYIFF